MNARAGRFRDRLRPDRLVARAARARPQRPDARCRIAGPVDMDGSDRRELLPVAGEHRPGCQGRREDRPTGADTRRTPRLALPLASQRARHDATQRALPGNSTSGPASRVPAGTTPSASGVVIEGQSGSLRKNDPVSGTERPRQPVPNDPVSRRWKYPYRFHRFQREWSSRDIRPTYRRSEGPSVRAPTRCRWVRCSNNLRVASSARDWRASGDRMDPRSSAGKANSLTPDFTLESSQEAQSSAAGGRLIDRSRTAP